MKTKIFLLLIIAPVVLKAQEEVPFRSEDDYELKLEYEFKLRSYSDSEVVNYVEEKDRDPLPHLTIFVSILNPDDKEERVKIIDNSGRNRYNSKLKDEPIRLIMGFTVDMKEKTTAHIYTVYISTKKKEPLNKIVLEVQEDGTFLVNGKKNGKL